MYKIIELKDMELEQLQSIASELKIKNVKKKDKESLIYEILDQEAVIDSKNAPEKKRRGRPKKERTETPVQADDAAVKEETAPADKQEAKPRKRRTRKTDAAEQTTPVEQPAVQTEENGTEDKQQTKGGKPGRKPRQKVQQQETVEAKTETAVRETPVQETVKKAEIQNEAVTAAKEAPEPVQAPRTEVREQSQQPQMRRKRERTGGDQRQQNYGNGYHQNGYQNNVAGTTDMVYNQNSKCEYCDKYGHHYTDANNDGICDHYTSNTSDTGSYCRYGDYADCGARHHVDHGIGSRHNTEHGGNGNHHSRHE